MPRSRDVRTIRYGIYLCCGQGSDRAPIKAITIKNGLSGDPTLYAVRHEIDLRGAGGLSQIGAAGQLRADEISGDRWHIDNCGARVKKIVIGTWIWYPA